MSYDLVVKTDVEHLVVYLTRGDQLVIVDHSVPILQGLLDRSDAMRLRPRMEQRDFRFNRLGAAQERPNRDWPYVIAWVLMAMTLLPARGRTPSWIFFTLFVLVVASFLSLVLALLRSQQIEQVTEDPQRINSVPSAQMLLGMVALGTLVLCGGLVVVAWIFAWRPFGSYSFGEIAPFLVSGIAFALVLLRGIWEALVGSWQPLAKWIKQKLRANG